MMRAAIFDLDGTLIDSLEDIANAMNFSLERHGLPTHPIAAYRAFVGAGVETLTRRALPADAGAFASTVLATYRARYVEHSLDATRPFDGVLDLLEALRAHDVKLAVLSNKPDPSTRSIVEHFFGSRFAVVCGERAGVARKPEPTAALEVLRMLDASAQRSAFIGDSSIDMRTGRAAGLCAIGVTWGLRDEAELRESGAQYLAHHPTELLPLLLGAG